MPQGAVTGSLGFENLQGNPGYTRTDYTSVTSETQIDVAFGDGVITNLFNYRHLKNEFQSDYDGTPAYIFDNRSEEHTSELQSLMRISYAVFCLKKKNNKEEQNEKYHTKHKRLHYN